jgi:hexosaminidase
VRAVAFTVLVLVGAFLAMAAPQPDTSGLSIVPLPQSVTRGHGTFVLTASTVIVADAPFTHLGHQLAAMIGPATGFDLGVRPGRAPGSNFLALREDAALEKTLGAEGYRLESTAKGVTIRAATPAGVFYGIETLRQLLPTAIFRSARVGGIEWRIPAVSIDDMPRFSWRGGHLDVARHFMPTEFVKKYIDLLALHKMNRFHWHLTDDQGWRIEIRQYPKLTEVGGWRPETLVGHEPGNPALMTFDHQRYGGFYTQDDIREIVAYAADRFVTVVPEIEMPGHSQEVVAAYPELGCTTDHVDPRTHWGVSPYLLNADDSTIAFMQNVLGEVIQLFPGPWIHIGGDEATKEQWKASAEIQARIAALGLKDEDDLQSWFIGRMDAYLTSHGRRLVGWDEILQGGVAAHATVMSWQGVNGAIAAARAGHDAVLTPGATTYFDHYQSRDTTQEPLAISGFLPLDTVYTWEPMPAALEPQFQAHILGVQGQLWTEYLPDPKAVEYMAYPRMSALAEVAWTTSAARHVEDFHARLAVHLERLTALDVKFWTGK